MVNQTFLDNFKQTYPDITVVAVTKYTDVAGVLAFWQAGVRDFGENRADAYLNNKRYRKRPGILLATCKPIK